MIRDCGYVESIMVLVMYKNRANVRSYNHVVALSLFLSLSLSLICVCVWGGYKQECMHIYMYNHIRLCTRLCAHTFLASKVNPLDSIR